jgi:hypothetical protein
MRCCAYRSVNVLTWSPPWSTRSEWWSSPALSFRPAWRSCPVSNRGDRWCRPSSFRSRLVSIHPALQTWSTRPGSIHPARLMSWIRPAPIHPAPLNSTARRSLRCIRTVLRRWQVILLSSSVASSCHNDIDAHGKQRKRQIGERDGSAEGAAAPARGSSVEWRDGCDADQFGFGVDSAGHCHTCAGEPFGQPLVAQCVDRLA